uniref:Uncharacterized protein n=1 Tax=uncultured Acidobacteriota bacterium TaxID=171953 RepID=G9C5G6_9BACT|nr:hypothetical protein PSI-P [uncultured Acidobacteriota bacterium]
MLVIRRDWFKVFVGLVWASAGMASSQDLPLIAAPMELAGPWQAETSLCGKPQAVGFHLRLFTELVDQREHLRSVSALLTTTNFEGWFSDLHKNFDLDGRRLLLRVAPSKALRRYDDLQLDVQFNGAARQWSGSLTCNGDARGIVLVRPHSDASRSSSPPTGVWEGRSDKFGFVGCLHSSLQENGEAILWIDRESGGQMAYGERLSGGLQGNELRFFEPNASGNEQSFAGTISADGSRIEGDWSAPLRIRLVFKRVEDGACTLASLP